jgi:hypothetical protein
MALTNSEGEWNMQLTMKKPLLKVFSFLFLLGVARADAGEKITGTVKDQTNAVIPGATVVAVNIATGVKHTTTTNAQGSYSFPILPVGQYEIDVTADGFKLRQTTGLTVNTSTGLTVDVMLELKGQKQTVTVTGG